MTVRHRFVRRWFSVLLLSLVSLLTGCHTLDVEITTPDTITQHQAFAFSAAIEQEDAEAVIYTWKLDGKVISNLEAGQAILSQAGAHTLSVTVSDDRDREGEASVVLDATAAPVLTPDFDLTLRASDLTGFAIEGVAIEVNGLTGTTDASGSLSFENILLNPVMVIKASADGYMDQSYRYEFSAAQDAATVVLTLAPQAAPVTFDSSAEQTLSTPALNTEISLPADAFVDADGNPVTGNVDLAMTPIDIRQIGAAFPGGGQALTEEGEVVALVTTGMIDFEFTQNGEPLQLAPGATATIGMDLVSTVGADGRILAEGDTIEMWWFDTESGLWVEEGTGIIVASATSPTGLALTATVTHFTTWNWDYYKAEDRASFVLTCTVEGQPMGMSESCFVRVVGGTLNRTFTLDNNGVTAINLPPNITFSVYGELVHSGTQIFRGTTSFTTISGTVSANVDLQSYPTDTGTVTCFISDGTNTSQVACDGTATDDSGTYTSFTTDPTTLIGSFEYVSDELVTVSANIQGFTETQTIDTSLLAGALSVQLTANVGLGTVTCSATLDNGPVEYFPCAGRITDDLAGEYVFQAGDYSGSPLTGTFAFNDNASVLTVELANSLNGASISVYNWNGTQNVYVNGTPDTVMIDLNTDPAVINQTYAINSADLYSISCVDVAGLPVSDCYVSIYGQYESRLYEGLLSDAPEYGPSWMASSILFADDAEALSSFGYANSFDPASPQGGEYYSIDYQVDTVAKTVIFTMEFYGGCIDNFCGCPDGSCDDIPIIVD